jgi:hypothetical protein
LSGVSFSGKILTLDEFLCRHIPYSFYYRKTPAPFHTLSSTLHFWNLSKISIWLSRFFHSSKCLLFIWLFRYLKPGVDLETNNAYINNSLFYLTEINLSIRTNRTGVRVEGGLADLLLLWIGKNIVGDRFPLDCF